MAKLTSRLSSETWLAAGLTALATSGPNALKAEPLARSLGTTKGSFYWHFKDVPDFQAKILAHWRAEADTALAANAAAHPEPGDRLHHIGSAIHTDPNGIEPAIRSWADTNAKVAAVLAEVDTARLAYLAENLSALGLTNPDFPRLAYGALIGLAALPETPGSDPLSTLTAAFLALRDA